MSERRYEIWPDKDLAEALDDIDTRLKALEASETLLNDTTVADAQAGPIRQNVDTCEDVSAICPAMKYLPICTKPSKTPADVQEDAETSSVSERTKVHDTCSSVQDNDGLCADGHAMEDALRTDCTATGDKTPDFPTQENDGIQESVHTPEDDSRGCDTDSDSIGSGLVDEVAREIARFARAEPEQIMAEDEEEARTYILKVADWLEDVPPHERTGLLPEDLLRAEVEE